MIDNAGLKIINLFEVKPTIWHRLVRKCLWKIPKSLVVKTSKLPQAFAMTEAFKTARSAGAKTYIFALYAKAITRLAVLFPPYKYLPIGSDITNKKLFIRLKHK